MRRIVSILVGLFLCGSAWAGVTITLTKVSDTKIAIGYDATSEPQLVRAFALDITATDGNIVDINDYAVGDDNNGYGIFPGNFSRYITVNPTTGEVENWGVGGYTPLAPPDTPGALGGLGTDGITIEMGSLYDTNPPSKTGVLCTITVSKGTCRLCVEGNAIRGNIVMEDASEMVPAQACIESCCPLDCFPNGPGYARQYADWVTYGKPDCWCNSAAMCGGPSSQLGDYQCDGDADGKTEGAITKYRCGLNDLNIIIANWKKKMGNPTLNPCADIDHKPEGLITKYRVSLNDLNRVIACWKKKDPQLPGDCPRPE